MKEKTIDTFLYQALVLFGAMVQSIIITFFVWASEGFPKGFSQVDTIVLLVSLITWGIILFVPLIIVFIRRFKVVRR